MTKKTKQDLDERLNSIMSKFFSGHPRGDDRYGSSEFSTPRMRRALKLFSKLSNIEDSELEEYSKNYDGVSGGLAQSVLYTRGKGIKSFNGDYAGAFIDTKNRNGSGFRFKGNHAGLGASFVGRKEAGAYSSFKGDYAGAYTFFHGEDAGKYSSFKGDHAGTWSYFFAPQPLSCPAEKTVSFEGKKAGFGSHFTGMWPC